MAPFLYEREQAVAYANTYWQNYNPQFKRFSDDCTNFISQCLFAGGMPIEVSASKSRGWWYRGIGQRAIWSYSWTVANSLYWYLRKRDGVKVVPKATDLRLGDVICYDWEGDGKWNHNTMVTGFNENGEPLVNAHTRDSQARYWRYQDSPGYTKNTRYAFFQIG
ncbi:amidase domain-containing protein [Risungbinella massiliensis]|uniref:amidase domain-containing protein n=1 Tax=Risungbinella massiliensis TaxID=1329796 RepID=UPI000699BB6A|nr:amidase domain-containing protein [Risungbinella massiliensis]